MSRGSLIIIESKMKQNIIYIRVSSEEQNPQNQLKDCETLATKLSLNDCEVLEEKTSAFKKNIKRKIFDSIKKAIENNQIKNLICWDLDRLFRNRKKLISFFAYCKNYNCKIYSARQEWLEGINKIQEPFNEIVYNLLLQVMGWLAEDESKKKSDRVRSAIRKEKGKTISYKGNKWGRKSLSKKVINKVLKLHKQGISMRQISKQVHYWDKNNNKKLIALSSVHKIITQSKRKRR